MKGFFIVTVALAASFSSANLIVNGSFETPVISAGFQTVLAGSGALTGWTVGGTSIDIVSQVFFPTYPARDGNQSIDLSGTPGPGDISQSFATSIGQFYNVYFSGSTNSGSNSMQVFLNGGLLYTITTPPQGTWVDYGYMFQASSTTSSIGFGSLFTGNAGPMVDRVIVERAVPEPASVVVLALGAGLLARRRRKVA